MIVQKNDLDDLGIPLKSGDTYIISKKNCPNLNVEFFSSFHTHC